MNVMTDELDDAANPNARQVWIATLWTALVMASAGTVLLDAYEAPDEPDEAKPVARSMAPVLLTAFGSPIWTGHGHAGPDIAMSSMPHKPSWVIDTAGDNK